MGCGLCISERCLLLKASWTASSGGYCCLKHRSLPFAHSPSKCLPQLELDQAKARSWQGSESLSHHLLPVRVTSSRKLEAGAGPGSAVMPNAWPRDKFLNYFTLRDSHLRSVCEDEGDKRIVRAQKMTLFPSPLYVEAEARFISKVLTLSLLSKSSQFFEMM